MNKVSFLLVFCGLLLMNEKVISQTITSSQTGAWNDPLTWIGGTVPTSANSTAIILDHTVTVPSGYSVTIDQTTISATGLLQIDNSGTVTLANGAGNDLIIAGSILSLDVSGTLIVNNSAAITGSTITTTVFESGGVYQHKYTTAQGTIPLATWDATPGAAATLKITGYTSFTTPTAGGNWGQAFGNLEWNCPSQTATITMAGLLNTIQGNLNVFSTGSTGILRFVTTGTVTINVNENFNVTGGARVIFCTTGICTINVGGNYSQNLTSGYIHFAESGGGVGTLNITGNFDLQAGILTEVGASPAQGNINFVGTSGTAHTFTEAGSPTTTLSNTLSFSVGADNELTAIGESQLAGGTTSFFSLGTNAILRAESTDASGAVQNGTGQNTTGGNLRVTNANRTYGAGSQIIYDGSSAQFMGTGSPTVAGITTIINNPAGVSRVGTNLNLLGSLTLQTGDLTVSNTNLSVNGTTDLQASDILFTTLSNSRTLTLNGDVNLGGNIVVTSGSSNATLTLGGDLTGSQFISFSGANSNLIINGSGAFSMDFPLPPGPTSIESITVTRTGGTVVFAQDLTAVNVTLNNGDMDMNANLIMTGSINLATGTTLFFEDHTLELRNLYNNTLTGGLLSSNAASTLNITTSGTLGTIAFSPAGNTVGTFLLNRPTAGTLVTLNSALTVNSAFNLLDGIFANTSGLNMGSGAVFTRNSNASITGSVPTGGAYNLIYTGVSLTTGVEAMGSLSNVTSNATGTITLNTALVDAGLLSINSGTFTSGVNAIVTGSLLNGGTFTAPSTTMSIGGNITNNGTFNRSGGTVLFNGTASVLGSTNPTFHNLTISSGTFTPPAILNLTGAFTNNGTFITGSGTVSFLGTAGSTQVVSGSSITDFNNITVANTTANPDVQIESNQNLKGNLTLASNVLFDADGSGGTSVFTLKSSNDSPTSDASIDILPAGAQVIGSVTVERYMAIEGIGGQSYRYISSPVQNASVADMQAKIPVTGAFPGSSVCTGCTTQSSMFLYNETVTTDTDLSGTADLDDGYEDFPVSSSSEIFSTGRGYAMFVRGDVLSSALWNLRGPINQGNASPVSLAPTFTSSGTLANDGWNLLGNPFPSTIDWNSASGWTKTNIAASINIYDDAAGKFATWNGVTGTNGGTRYIAIGQAFWIQATASPTLRANENVKKGGQPTTFFREAAMKDALRVALVQGSFRDETVIHFRSDAQPGYDTETDSRKFDNAIFNLSSILSSGEILAINSSPFVCGEPIKLNISNASIGTYQLDFSQMETFSGEIDITLTDNFLNRTFNVLTTNQYAFDITSSPASLGANRFSLTFSEKSATSEITTSADLVCEGKDAILVIENSRTDTHYQVFKDGVAASDSIQGNGANLPFNILNANLLSGINNVIIHTTSNRCLTSKNYESSILVSQKPTVTVTSGTTCKQGKMTLIATSPNANDTFKWYEDATSEIVLATTSEYFTPSITKSRIYFVATLSSAGCLSDRAPAVAKVIQYEDLVISKSEDGSLQSNYTEGNTWYFNGVEIKGTTSNKIIPDKSGTYKAEVLREGCRSSFEYEFTITALEEMYLNSGITIYPNPVTEKAYIDIAENKMDIHKAVLYNNIGNAIADAEWEKEGKHQRGVIDMKTLPNGIYFIRLFTSNGTLSLKIIKK